MQNDFWQFNIKVKIIGCVFKSFENWQNIVTHDEHQDSIRKHLPEKKLTINVIVIFKKLFLYVSI